jgi:hypothetical protein
MLNCQKLLSKRKRRTSAKEQTKESKAAIKIEKKFLNTIKSKQI